MMDCGIGIFFGLAHFSRPQKGANFKNQYAPTSKTTEISFLRSWEQGVRFHSNIMQVLISQSLTVCTLGYERHFKSTERKIKEIALPIT